MITPRFIFECIYDALALPLSMQFILVRVLKSQSFYCDTWFHAEFHELLTLLVPTDYNYVYKTFKANSFSERKGLLSKMLARERTRPVACRLNHQPQDQVEKTDVSAALRLMRLFYTMSLGKKDRSCFERIYIGSG